MAIKKFSPLLAENPLCGIGEYKDVLDLSTGSVTRRIKKLVLTGKETEYWTLYNGNYYGSMTDRYSLQNMPCRCTHTAGGIIISDGSVRLKAYASQFTTVASNIEEWKSYLAAQYAAGTPVTVWYVLATPETETITVPSGLTGTIEGYLTQSETPTPSAPIYPEANPALAWGPTSYRKFGTETDAITSLPAQIIGDGQAITSCQISGNTVQNGTPTPEAPVDVLGCGEKTENLFDEMYPNIRLDMPEYRSIFVGDGEFTLSTMAEKYGSSANLFFLTGRVNSGAATATNGVWKENPRTITSLNGYVTIAYRYYDDEKSDPRFNTAMLNAGSTALPYEPYGYKLSLTVNNTEYPIYLGQVESTRRVKKLVLTGREPNWNVASTNLWHLQISDIPAVTILDSRSLYCTHYNGVASKTTYSGLTNGNTCIYASNFIWIRDSQFASLSDFKSYLFAQYANGTPVTIWYVLATEETAVANEPLMKIGDYADTVVATNVPTTGTPENFDVLTTLKPSEVSLTYHGWHEHTDTKYTQGE